MIKYIDADRLKTEFENIYSEAICEYNSHKSRYSEGALDVAHRISSLINSLQQEVEVNEFSFKGGTAIINGVEHPFKPGKAKVIILDITENES